MITSFYHLFSLVAPFKVCLVAFNSKQGGKIIIHVFFTVKRDTVISVSIKVFPLYANMLQCALSSVLKRAS